MFVGCRERSAPGPAGGFLLGSLPAIRRDRLGFLVDIAQKYGDTVRFRMGPRVLHFVNSPEGIKHVLQDNCDNYRKGVGLAEATPLLGNGILTSDGALWKRNRGIVQAAFREWTAPDVALHIANAVSSTMDKWHEAACNGRALDIAAEMQRLALSALGRSMFSIDFEAETGAISNALTIVGEEAIHRMSSPVAWPSVLPTRRNRRLHEALGVIDRVVDTIIEHSTRVGDDNPNFVASLSRPSNTHAGMGLRQLRDEVKTMLVAGHETTATAMTWLWYQLSKSPGVARRVRQEVQETIGSSVVTLSELNRLRYTTAVIEESFRLFPPVWVIPRQAIENDEIDGYHIPAGSGVIISPYVIHRHPTYWENPEGFDPDRFLDRDPTAQPNYAYCPFGGGPRSCLGRQMGTMEAQIVLATVARTFTLHLVPGQQIMPDPLLTLRPRGKVMMTIHPCDGILSSPVGSRLLKPEKVSLAS
jgi:cytochrome P450